MSRGVTKASKAVQSGTVQAEREHGQLSFLPGTRMVIGVYDHVTARWQ